MLQRRLDRLVSLSNEERFPILGQGLRRLGDRVAHLTGTVTTLEADGDIVAAAALDVICTEEAAKVLILLDLARCMHPQKAFKNGCRYFYNHLARGIYAHIHDASPADFAEILRYVEDLRPSHYLDGPNDADWIFRNEVLRDREAALYVDYEETQPGEFEWTGGDPELLFVPARLSKLVLALRTAGILTETGARSAASAWKGSRFDASTRWEFCRERADRILAEVAKLGAKDPSSALVEAWHTVREQWTFPLTQLDLTMDEITIEEMSDRQERHYAKMLADEYGPFDY